MTTSGNFFDQALITAVLSVGADHILFASDYPYRWPPMRHAELNERQSVKGTGATSGTKLDSAVVDVAVEAFGANAKPYAHISALWVFGANTSITEESPYNAPAMVAWKEAIDHRILGEPGMRGILIISGTAYGDGGGGIPGILLGLLATPMAT